jgi:hypothetical protein
VTIREVLGKIIRRFMDPDKVGECIAEGLDAMETKFFQREGWVIEQYNVVAWRERRAYIALAAEYAGYHGDAKEKDNQAAPMTG